MASQQWTACLHMLVWDSLSIKEGRAPGDGSVRTQNTVRWWKEGLPTSATKRRLFALLVPTLRSFWKGLSPLSISFPGRVLSSDTSSSPWWIDSTCPMWLPRCAIFAPILPKPCSYCVASFCGRTGTPKSPVPQVRCGADADVFFAVKMGADGEKGYFFYIRSCVVSKNTAMNK